MKWIKTSEQLPYNKECNATNVLLLFKYKNDEHIKIACYCDTNAEWSFDSAYNFPRVYQYYPEKTPEMELLYWMDLDDIPKPGEEHECNPYLKLLKEWEGRSPTDEELLEEMRNALKPD